MTDTCRHGTPLSRFCDFCKSECFTVTPKPAVAPLTRVDLIAGNIASLARNEAAGLTLEGAREGMARLTIMRALHAATKALQIEWGASGWLGNEARDAFEAWAKGLDE